MFTKLVCLIVVSCALVASASGQSKEDCGKTRIRCGAECGGSFCEFPKKCGTLHFCEHCTKVKKVCVKVKTPCGSAGLECSYDEECVEPCFGKKDCKGDLMSHKCMRLPKEKYTECKDVVNMRCLPADEEGKPMPFVLEGNDGKVAEGWKIGDKCGVAYCPKARICMQINEQSCVGQVGACGDIDCPIGYVCQDRAACEKECVEVSKEECVTVADKMEPLIKSPFCKTVPDCE